MSDWANDIYMMHNKFGVKEWFDKNKDNKDSIQKAKRRDSKIRWYYRQERLKKRFVQLLAKFGIKLNATNEDDTGDDLYEEFKKFSKK